MKKRLLPLTTVLFLCGGVQGTKKLTGLTLEKIGATKVDCKGTTINYLWPKSGTAGCIHFYAKDKDYYCFANTFRNNAQDPLSKGQKNNVDYIKVSTLDQYDWLPTKIDGKDDWITTEHYFHAQKFTDPLGAYNKMLTEKIIKKNTPEPIYPGDLPKAVKGNEFKKLATRFTDWTDWDKISHLVMLKAVRAKFSQHDVLRKILLGTNPNMIIEDTAQASYTEETWGAGKNYTGCNLLGQILMHVRQELIDGKLYKFVKGDALDYYQLLSGQTAWQEDTNGDTKYVPEGYADELKKSAVPIPSAPPSGTTEAVTRVIFFNYDPTEGWGAHLYKDKQKGVLRGYESAQEIRDEKASRKLADDLTQAISLAVKGNLKFSAWYSQDRQDRVFIPLKSILDGSYKTLPIEKETREVLCDTKLINTETAKLRGNVPPPYPPTGTETKIEPGGKTTIPAVDDHEVRMLAQVLHGMVN